MDKKLELVAYKGEKTDEPICVVCEKPKSAKKCNFIKKRSMHISCYIADKKKREKEEKDQRKFEDAFEEKESNPDPIRCRDCHALKDSNFNMMTGLCFTCSDKNAVDEETPMLQGKPFTKEEVKAVNNIGEILEKLDRDKNGESKVITIGFADYPELHTKVAEEAKKGFRSFEMQILFIISNSLMERDNA